MPFAYVCLFVCTATSTATKKKHEPRLLRLASYSCLQAEEVGDGADIVRKDELPEAHNSRLVPAVLEVELPKQLSDLQRVFQCCQRH